MARPKPVVHELALVWTGIRFKVVLLQRPMSKWMKRRCQSSFTFVRDNDRVVLYAIDQPIHQDRARAIANSYLSAPEVMIDAIFD
jgi:hypothetical protein